MTGKAINNASQTLTHGVSMMGLGWAAIDESSTPTGPQAISGSSHALQLRVFERVARMFHWPFFPPVRGRAS